jgi:hypothetical protein
VLVAVGSTQLSRKQQQYSLTQSLGELAGLAETAGVKVSGIAVPLLALMRQGILSDVRDPDTACTRAGGGASPAAPGSS